ncbi:MAG: hypothetical protein V4591_07310 [Bdellovibrionota bacterium]
MSSPLPLRAATTGPALKPTPSKPGSDPAMSSSTSASVLFTPKAPERDDALKGLFEKGKTPPRDLRLSERKKIFKLVQTALKNLKDDKYEPNKDVHLRDKADEALFLLGVLDNLVSATGFGGESPSHKNAVDDEKISIAADAPLNQKPTNNSPDYGFDVLYAEIWTFYKGGSSTLFQLSTSEEDKALITRARQLANRAPDDKTPLTAEELFLATYTKFTATSPAVISLKNEVIEHYTAAVDRVLALLDMPEEKAIQQSDIHAIQALIKDFIAACQKEIKEKPKITLLETSPEFQSKVSELKKLKEELKNAQTLAQFLLDLKNALSTTEGDKSLYKYDSKKIDTLKAGLTGHSEILTSLKNLTKFINNQLTIPKNSLEYFLDSGNQNRSTSPIKLIQCQNLVGKNSDEVLAVYREIISQINQLVGENEGKNVRFVFWYGDDEGAINVPDYLNSPEFVHELSKNGLDLRSTFAKNSAHIPEVKNADSGLIAIAFCIAHIKITRAEAHIADQKIVKEMRDAAQAHAITCVNEFTAAAFDSTKTMKHETASTMNELVLDLIEKCSKEIQAKEGEIQKQTTQSAFANALEVDYSKKIDELTKLRTQWTQLISLIDLFTYMFNKDDRKTADKDDYKFQENLWAGVSLANGHTTSLTDEKDIRGLLKQVTDSLIPELFSDQASARLSLTHFMTTVRSSTTTPPQHVFLVTQPLSTVSVAAKIIDEHTKNTSIQFAFVISNNDGNSSVPDRNFFESLNNELLSQGSQIQIQLKVGIPSNPVQETQSDVNSIINCVDWCAKALIVKQSVPKLASLEVNADADNKFAMERVITTPGAEYALDDVTYMFVNAVNFANTSPFNIRNNGLRMTQNCLKEYKKYLLDHYGSESLELRISLIRLIEKLATASDAPTSGYKTLTCDIEFMSDFNAIFVYNKAVFAAAFKPAQVRPQTSQTLPKLPPDLPTVNGPSAPSWSSQAPLGGSGQHKNGSSKIFTDIPPNMVESDGVWARVPSRSQVPKPPSTSAAGKEEIFISGREVRAEAGKAAPISTTPSKKSLLDGFPTENELFQSIKK